MWREQKLTGRSAACLLSLDLLTRSRSYGGPPKRASHGHLPKRYGQPSMTIRLSSCRVTAKLSPSLSGSASMLLRIIVLRLLCWMILIPLRWMC